MVEDETELSFMLGAAPVGVVLMDNSFLYINRILLVLLLSFAFWSLLTTVTTYSYPKCPFSPLLGSVFSVHLCILWAVPRRTRSPKTFNVSACFPTS